MAVEEKRVSINGVKVRYQMVGEGAPVLLIHGLGSSVVSWERNIEPLSQGHRVYALDLPGHGDSDKPKRDYTLSYGSEFIRDFIEVLGLGRASLVGNSIGGLLSLDVALRFPEKVDKLVLVSSAGLGKELGFFLRFPAVPFIGELLTTPSRIVVRLLLRRIFHDSSFVTSQLVEKSYRYRKLPEARWALLSAFRHGLSFWGLRRHAILREDLPRIAAPTLIVWGERDRLFPVAQAYAASDLIPDSRLKVFPDCGHWPQMERAGEFNELVLDFLKA